MLKVYPNLFEKYLETLPKKPTKPMWSDGIEILCESEELANKIARDFENLMGEDILTCYYDPVEDGKDGCVNEYTGWWSVYMFY